MGYICYQGKILRINTWGGLDAATIDGYISNNENNSGLLGEIPATKVRSMKRKIT